uniref:Uncharacterized protein n=1 Tax=viral metagenome TaxID=1070528 RepID=A0A6M3LUD0_9ZZZZ
MKTHYVTIPVTESEPDYDEGAEGQQFIAQIDAPNGRKAAGIGETKYDAIRNLLKANGPITRSAVESYING